MKFCTSKFKTFNLIQASDREQCEAFRKLYYYPIPIGILTQNQKFRSKPEQFRVDLFHSKFFEVVCSLNELCSLRDLLSSAPEAAAFLGGFTNREPNYTLDFRVCIKARKSAGFCQVLGGCEPSEVLWK